MTRFPLAAMIGLFAWSSIACSPFHGSQKVSRLAEATPALADHDLQTRLDQILIKGLADNRYAGLSIAVMKGSTELYQRHFGFRDIGQNLPPDDHTVYELGSISKVFTRLLLEMDPEVSLSDPLSKYLPSNIHAPAPAGKEMRIQDLALHTGFRFSVPCVPKAPEFEKFECFGMHLYDDPDVVDPYKDGSRDLLFQYVDAYSSMLASAPAEQFPAPGLYYSYSNAGMALLGELLALKHHSDYDQLAQSQLLNPLGMHETYSVMPCEGTRISRTKGCA